MCMPAFEVMLKKVLFTPPQLHSIPSHIKEHLSFWLIDCFDKGEAEACGVEKTKKGGGRELCLFNISSCPHTDWIPLNQNEMLHRNSSSIKSK